MGQLANARTLCAPVLLIVSNGTKYPLVYASARSSLLVVSDTLRGRADKFSGELEHRGLGHARGRNARDIANVI